MNWWLLKSTYKNSRKSQTLAWFFLYFFSLSHSTSFSLLCLLFLIMKRKLTQPTKKTNLIVSFFLVLLLLFFYSQWWGLGGSSLGWATVELAKLLYAADEGLMQRGTRLELIWSKMNRCILSLTFETQVKSRSHSSSNGRSADGSNSLEYCLIPDAEVWQQPHMQEWYRSLPSSR